MAPCNKYIRYHGSDHFFENSLHHHHHHHRHHSLCAITVLKGGLCVGVCVLMCVCMCKYLGCYVKNITCSNNVSNFQQTGRLLFILVQYPIIVLYQIMPACWRIHLALHRRNRRCVERFPRSTLSAQFHWCAEQLYFVQSTQTHTHTTECEELLINDSGAPCGKGASNLVLK